MDSSQYSKVATEMNTAVITVYYNSSGVIGNFLSGLPEWIKTIVVDNASDDRHAVNNQTRPLHPIALDENVGYGAACNIGAAATDASFLLFANPDVRFSKGVIEAFLHAAADYPQAAFNPLIYSNGSLRLRKWSRLLPGSELSKGLSPADRILPVLSGACIFIRREHFERVGGFDPKIFLFHEDDDLSVRLKQAGIELRLAADAVIEHSEGESSGRSLKSERIKGEAMGRSLVYVMRKHGVRLDLAVERRKAMFKLLLPQVLFSGLRRTKLLGFLHGLHEGAANRVGDDS